MAKSNIPFSKATLLSLAVLLTASVAVPLTKRGLLTSAMSNLKSDFENIETGVTNTITTTCSGSSNPLCLGENVVAAVLSSLLAVGKQASSVSNTVGYSNTTSSDVADNVVAAAATIATDAPVSITSTVATATSTHVDILSKVLADVKAVPSEVKSVFDNAGLNLLGVYNMSNAATILNKVETDAKNAIAKVKSVNGKIVSDVEGIHTRVENVENKVHSAVGNVEERIQSAAADVKNKAENAIDTAKSTVDTILHFNSSLGEHLVTSLGSTDLTELSTLIANAIPGVPNFANATNSIEEALGVATKVKTAAEDIVGDFEKAIDVVKNLTSASPLEDIEKAVTALKSVASGAGDNLETAAQKAGSNVISWISYNIKGSNGDISKVISELSNFNMSSIASEITDFITNDGGYKFCLNPSTLLSGLEGSNSAASALTAVGEVFLNTYGSVDSICL
ncbi:hypothetical protein C6P45_000561 [Maudiozyma exigua]|uniref:Uncharacterized protein n=1 Tax=Maudiozyma exigua TaxID=34358 RepID=A0A9P6W7S6_MAUEX|nr:hypothetical protein C6P45_000561 [Kazachstania exigua]